MDIDTYGQWLLICEAEEWEADVDDEQNMVCAAALTIAFLGAEEARAIRKARRQATRQYLTRPELLSNPRLVSPWQKLYESKSDRAFITTMGFDVEAFQSILQNGFAQRWYTTPISRTDISSQALPRPHRRSLDAAGALGLVLHYLNSTMREVSLQEIFALITSTVSRYIIFSLKVLYDTLRTIPETTIIWPRGDQFELFSSLIQQRHHLLVGAFGSIDGLNIPVQTSSNQEIENATYNGWLSEHFVSSVLVFSPEGAVIAARINAPGSWHDSRVAQRIYEKLITQTPEGYYLVADTAFPRGSKHVDGRIRAPLKAGEKLKGSHEEIQDRLAFNRQLLSYRQTAEWGMRALQGSFGRLRVPLEISRAEERAHLLETCIRLHNFRTRVVGINQIRTVYFKQWSEGDVDGHLWDSFEHVLFSDQRKNDRVARYHVDVVYE